jgi:hypothetical protein
MVAAVALLAVVASGGILCDFVRALAASPRPFARASRIASRVLGGWTRTKDEEWTRYESNGRRVETGPARVLIDCRFASRNDADEMLEALLVALGHPTTPPIAIPSSGEVEARGTAILRRQPIGVEAMLVQDDDGWRMMLVLTDGGPRTVSSFG